MWKSNTGSVLLESVVLLPVVLFTLLASGQFAHIWYARQMVNYAAFAAARAQRAGIDTDAAAQSVCAVLAITGSDAPFEHPFAGTIPGGSAAADSGRTVVAASSTQRYHKARVDFRFPLIVPVVNSFVAGVYKIVYDNNGSQISVDNPAASPFTMDDGDIFPYITITGTALLPEPGGAI